MAESDAAVVFSGRRIAALTGTRALAVLLVLATHAAFATGSLLDGYIGAMYARLDVGVSMFFVLSGFLLCRPWVYAAATRSQAPSIAHYAGRRVRRIVPAYVVTVLLAYAVYLLMSAGANPGQSWTGLAHHLTFTQIYPPDYLSTNLHLGLSQTWSLAVEVAFYAVLPLLAHLMIVLPCRSRWRPRRTLAAVSVLGAVSPLWLIAMTTTDRLPNSAGMWLPAHLIYFAGGVALAVLASENVRCPSRIAVPVGLVAFLTVSSPIAGGVMMGDVQWWQPSAKNVLYAVVTILVVAPLALGGGGLFERLMASRPMVWLGEISYEVFLLHVLVMAILYDVVLRWPPFSGSLAVLFALTLVCSVPSAWLLHRLTGPEPRWQRTGRPPTRDVGVSGRSVPLQPR
ncbi:acyltransferase [Mycobacterium antarcticum]|uniref:acyltransferase family protein n=1 Tax=Mycolicibacterium sp. TUM20983 TaxID=3023369 RepID=UPI00238365E3|nr:acyltransferase [Mycolicibacterium sp. TUM20983]GLP76584.1 acyltransferase [Mycolicibacterium sp. TUM20983]